MSKDLLLPKVRCGEKDREGRQGKRAGERDSRKELGE